MFKNYYLFNTKLFWPTFNSFKFCTITHFIKCIENYINPINYNIIYSKLANKYFFKTFYREINKKKYKLQILIHNIYSINIIIMQNFILITKILDRNNTKNSLF